MFWTADDAEILSCTVKALKEGHVVAVPTDTIYGLACLAQSSEAISKTYDIKGRNQQKPLAICVGEIQDIYKWVFVRVSAVLPPELEEHFDRGHQCIHGLTASAVLDIL